MTACRPDQAQPRCANCRRVSLPINRKGPNGRVITELVIDPTAILKAGRVCPLFVA